MANKVDVEKAVAFYEKNQERSKRYLMKQRLLLKKAVAAKIVVTEAEIDAELAKRK